MAELDAEMLERVARWCAEAGRQAGAAEIRAALGSLGWDELLAVRALLADPPPARPLGPYALADLARGAPADVAAEREREGRYRREPTPSDEPPPTAGERIRAPRGSKKTRRPAEIVVRRARDRATPAPDAPAQLPALSSLLDPGGRAVLERLVRRHGARRAPILAELAAGWRCDDGGPPREEDLAALLDEHGLARAFERREHDELLHAFRAAGGVRGRVATTLGLAPEALDATVDRLSARGEVERIREDRRAELRGRATLTDRVHLLLEDPERLADLGILAEIEADLATRLPEHVRALRAGSEPVHSAFGRSLSLAPDAVSTLDARFALALGPDEPGAPVDVEDPGVRPRPRAYQARPAGRGGPERRDAPPGRTGREWTDRGAGSPRRPGRPGPERPAPRRTDRPRPERPRFERPSAPGTRTDRPRGDRPDRPRSDRLDRPRSDRPDRPRSDRPDRPRSDRPDRPRSDRLDRPRSDRPDRPRGDRPTGGRSGPGQRPVAGAPDRRGPGRTGGPSRRGSPGGGRPRPGGGRRPR